MKIQIRLFLAALVILLVRPAAAVVGYVNHPFGIGDSLFANPLKASPNNTLSNIFGYATVPDGTVVSLWNSTTKTFDTSSTYELGSWSVNFTLNPGTGAKLTTSLSFLNTFVGEVESHNGGPYADPLTPAPLFGGPNGIYLLADKAPVANTGTNIFLNILGRLPNVGEQVMTLTTTSTYLGDGNWDLIPTVAVSGAAFLNVGPVPEPTTVALTLIGFALAHGINRRRN